MRKINEQSSDNKKEFKAKISRMEKEGYYEGRSETGYSDTLVGMDDIDKIRRIKLNKRINNGQQ